MSKLTELESQIASKQPLPAILAKLDEIRAEVIASYPHAAGTLGLNTVSLRGSSFTTGKKPAPIVVSLKK